MKRREKPQNLPSLFFEKETPSLKQIITASKKGRALKRKLGSTLRPPGLKAAAAPATSKTLSISAPKTLPRASSPCFFVTAVKAVASSGRLVPKATMVTAITLSGTKSLLAISDDPRIRPSEAAARLSPQKSKIKIVL